MSGPPPARCSRRCRRWSRCSANPASRRSGRPAEPAPGMGQIGELIDGFRGVGLTIDTVASGRPCALPAAVDLVAYRAMQESLTNVGKHAVNAAVDVRLDYRPGTSRGRRCATPAPAEAHGPPVKTGSTGGFGLIGHAGAGAQRRRRAARRPQRRRRIRVAATLPARSARCRVATGDDHPGAARRRPGAAARRVPGADRIRRRPRGGRRGGRPAWRRWTGSGPVASTWC